MDFLIDAQLPPRLADLLKATGHTALHVYEILAPDAEDLDICEQANIRHAVLLTKDGDFVDLSARNILRGPLVWLRVGNMSNRAIWRKLGPMLPVIAESLNAGDRVIEIR